MSRKLEPRSQRVPPAPMATSRPSLHVCVATGQNLANLIPALQLGARRVIILETPEMRASASNLKRALEAHGVEVLREPFDDSTPDAVTRSAEKIAVQLGEQPLVFNATGGHKLLTLALVEHMRMADALHVVYAETRYDRLDWLKPVAATESMDNVLVFEDILLAQGYRLVKKGDRDVQWMNDASARESLTRRFGGQAERFSDLFGQLNYLADMALANEPDGPFLHRQELPLRPAEGRILREAQDLKLLHWNGAREVVFASKDAAKYFRGGWLEEYAWLKLRGIKPHDFAVDVGIESTHGKTPNQFDAVLVHRNRLLVIECKTARLGRDAAKDADYIYKLAQLSRSVGGIMSGSLLLSARPVSDETRRRATENGVDVLASNQVADFVKYVRDWMGR